MCCEPALKTVCWTRWNGCRVSERTCWLYLFVLVCITSNAFQCLPMPSNAFQCLPMPSNAFQCLPMPSNHFQSLPITSNHFQCNRQTTWTYIARTSLNIEGLRACICTWFLLCCCAVVLLCVYIRSLLTRCFDLQVNWPNAKNHCKIFWTGNGNNFHVFILCRRPICWICCPMLRNRPMS
jgi:hypothetical protein